MIFEGILFSIILQKRQFESDLMTSLLPRQRYCGKSSFFFRCDKRVQIVPLLSVMCPGHNRKEYLLRSVCFRKSRLFARTSGASGSRTTCVLSRRFCVGTQGSCTQP